MAVSVGSGGFASALLVCAGCMSTSSEQVRVRGAEHPRIVGPAPGVAALRAELSYDAGVAQGVVHFAASCRDALVTDETIEEWSTIKPNRGAAVAAVLAGSVLGVGSGALLAHASDFSDERRCSYDSAGDSQCGSPRETALVVGFTGAVTALLAVSTGVATLGKGSERRLGASYTQAPQVTAIRRDGVACGRGPIRGLAVVLFRGDVAVSSSVTNEVGALAFAVPPSATGELTAVVDSVPKGLSFVRRGDVLGTVSVPPLADGE